MKVTRKENKVELSEIELESEGHPSVSGKTTVLFTTGGFIWDSENGIGINLTILRSKKSTVPNKPVESLSLTAKKMK